MQLTPPDPKIVAVRMALYVVAIVMLAYILIPTAFTNIGIIYVLLFAISIFIADQMIIKIPQEGQVTASVAITLTAILLSSTKLNLETLLLACLIGSLATALLHKQKFVSLSVFLASRTITVTIASYSFYLWSKHVGQNRFWYILLGAITAATVYFLVETTISAMSFSVEKATSFRASFISRTRLLAFVYFTFSIISLLMSIMFRWMDFWSVLIFSLPLAVTGQSFKLYLDIRRTYTSSIKALSAAIEAQDTKRVGHAQRVADYSIAIGQELGFYANDLDRLNYAAVLHDIGKLGFDKEQEIADQDIQDRKNIPFHAHVGADIISQVEYLKDVSSIIKYHHYRYSDKGIELPMEARIIHLADAFDHLTTLNKLSWAEALRKIKADKGIVYDPKVLRSFTSVLRRQRKTAIS